MDGTLPKISFLKLQGRGRAPITPRGWMGVDGMDLYHNINIHIKIFLMRNQKKLSSVELGF